MKDGSKQEITDRIEEGHTKRGVHEIKEDNEIYNSGQRVEVTEKTNYVISGSEPPISFFIKFYEGTNLEEAVMQVEKLAEDISLSDGFDETYIATTSATTYETVFGAKLEYVNAENSSNGNWKEIEPAKIPEGLQDKIRGLYSNIQFKPMEGM